MKSKVAIFGVIAVFVFMAIPTTRALTLQEILQGYNNPKGQVLGASTSPIVFINTTLCNGSTACTTPAINNTGADFLVATVISYSDNATTDMTVTDSTGSNTWHHLTAYNNNGNGNNRHIAIWYAYNATVSSSQTFSVSGPDGPITGIQVASYSGVQSSSDPFDVQNGGAALSGSTVQTGSVAPNENNALIYTGLWDEVSGSPGSIDSGFNLILWDASHQGQGQSYLVQSTAGAVNPTWTGNGGSGVRIAPIAVFKPAGSPGGSAPPVISSVSSASITSSTSTITWTTDENSDSQVEYGLTTAYSSASTLNSTLTTSHSVSLSSLSASTTYHYAVQSRDAVGNLSVSADNTFTTTSGGGTDTTPPSTPNNLSATAVSPSQINLTWTASTDNVAVTGYKVFRGGSQIGTSASNSYSDTGLSASTNYSYTVSAYDAAGNNSVQSSSASATTGSGASGGGSADVYEDWSCYTFTTASSVGGGKTNLTCNAPHGWTTGTKLIMWGATGSWVGLNTQLDQTVSNVEAISSTDSSMQVNDTSKVIPGSIMLIDAEQVRVDHVDANYIYFGPGANCSGSANGRGCNGTTATSHVATNGAGITVNNNFQPGWVATVINSTTIQIPFDSSNAGSFVGQNIHTSRVAPGDPVSPLVRVYLGQPWASWYDVGSDGLEIHIPAGTNCTTDPYTCSRGFLSAVNGKGYSFSNTQVTSAVFSGTFPNQVVTVTFATPFMDMPNNAVLTPASSAVNGLGALVYLTDFNESTTCTGCINHAYLVQSVIMSGGNKVGAVLMAGARHSVPNGTYNTVTSGTLYCNKSSPPCLVMPLPGDGYTDSNPSNSAGQGYPNGSVSSQIKNGGVWNPLNNRMTWLITYEGINRSGVCPTMELGTYAFFGDDPTDLSHMYQDTCPNFVNGQQMQLDYNEAWDHVVGAGPELYPNDAMYTVPGWLQAPAWRGGQRHFFDSLQRFYMDDSAGADAAVPVLTGSTMVIRSITFSQSPFNQPEEWVKPRSAIYDGSKYQFSWDTPPQGYVIPPDFNSIYNLSYSTSPSCTTDPFSSGTPGGSVTVPAGANHYAQYSTPNMSQASLACLFIRPTFPVYSTSPNGQSPIWLWTEAGIGMQAGDKITTSGIGGNGNVSNTPINSIQGAQMWSVKAPDSNQPWTAPGTMTSISSNSSGSCTVTLNGVNHHLAVGWPFYVFYPPATPASFSGLDQGLYTVTSVPSPTTFTFACPSAVPNTTWNTDQDTTHHFGIEAWPGVSLAGTASGLSLSNGTIISTEDTKNFGMISIATAGYAPSLPTISSFSASPSTVSSGGTASLSYSVSGATSVSIDNGLGSQANSSSGSVNVSPSATTTYTLTATNGAGSVTAQTTVMVSNPLPIISNLVGSNTTASTTQISWNANVLTNGQVFYGTSTAYGLQSPLLDNNPKTLSHSTVLTGLLPATLYHFKVTSIDGLSNSTTTPDFTFTTLNQSVPAPIISSFTANPVSITQGGSVTLSFTVLNSPASVSINQGVGSVLGQSSKTVSVTQTTTYTLTAVNAGGTASAQVTVTVSPIIVVATSTAPSILSFSVNPSSVIQGQSITLSWSVTGSSTPVTIINNNVGTASGTTVTVTPSQTTTYTLTASNSAGTATAQATVTVSTGSGGGSGGGGSGGSGGGSGGGGGAVTVYIPPVATAPTSSPSPQTLNSPLRLINIKGTYYLVINNVLHGITNPGMLNSYGFSLNQAIAGTAADQQLPQGSLLTPGDGSLVKSNQDKTVYLISSQTRYAFTSATVFTALGFKFLSVLLVTNPELQALPKASDLSDPKASHLPGLDINKNGTIYYIGADNQLHPYSSLTVYNSWHIANDFTKVVPANPADLSLPMGDMVVARVTN